MRRCDENKNEDKQKKKKSESKKTSNCFSERKKTNYAQL
jgi:hypothetical protein